MPGVAPQQQPDRAARLVVLHDQHDGAVQVRLVGEERVRLCQQDAARLGRCELVHPPRGGRRCAVYNALYALSVELRWADAAMARFREADAQVLLNFNPLKCKNTNACHSSMTRSHFGSSSGSNMALGLLRFGTLAYYDLLTCLLASFFC